MKGYMTFGGNAVWTNLFYLLLLPVACSLYLESQGVFLIFFYFIRTRKILLSLRKITFSLKNEISSYVFILLKGDSSCS